MTSTSSLFTDVTWRWHLYYIQALNEDSNEWITLPEKDFFGMQPFGYRTRLNQLLVKTHYSDGYDKWRTAYRDRLEQLTAWIAKEYKELHPKDSLVAIRILDARLNMKTNPSYSTRWHKPLPENFARSKVRILHTHNIKR